MFTDLSRGNPKPHTLKDAALVDARLTPETWRLEVVSDGTAKLDKQLTLAAGVSIGLPLLDAMLPIGLGAEQKAAALRGKRMLLVGRGLCLHAPLFFREKPA